MEQAAVVVGLQHMDIGHACIVYVPGCRGWQGSAEAWFHMGVMYLNGWGVKPSQRQALDCFTIAAQVGHVLGMYNLAIMHLNGRAGLGAADAKASCQPALALLKKIAEKGSWGGLVQQVSLFLPLYHAWLSNMVVGMTKICVCIYLSS